jgi:hypothetical protein
VDEQALQASIQRELEALRRELEGRVAADEVMRVGWARFHELAEAATISNYIPLLVCRRTREELLLLSSRSPQPAGAPQ